MVVQSRISNASMGPHESRIRVSQPPSIPTMIYDGECRFCRCQVERWKQRTGGAVVYVSSKAPQVREQFSEIPTPNFDHSLQFVTTEGWVYSGAHGALKALAIADRSHWSLQIYESSQIVSAFLEFGYRCVADHRGLLSRFSPCARRMERH